MICIHWCSIIYLWFDKALRKKATIHQVTTILATSKNVQCSGQNHVNRQYWWLFTRWCLGDNQSVGSSVPVVSRWLWPGNRTFLEVLTWWLPGGLCGFCLFFWVFLCSEGPNCRSWSLSPIEVFRILIWLVSLFKLEQEIVDNVHQVVCAEQQKRCSRHMLLYG